MIFIFAAGAISLCITLFLVIILPSKRLKTIAWNLESYRSNFTQATSFLTRDEVQVMRTMLNDAHLAKARELGVSGIENMDDLYAEIEKGRLVPLYENRFWRIRELKNSVPYVTPDTLRLLEDIGKRFHENLEKENLPVFRFTISSVLRTRQQHERLMRINRNASRTISSHEFGTSVDIAFRDFDYSAATPLLFRRLTDTHTKENFRKEDFDRLGIQFSPILKTILARTIIELQNEGKCYVIFERRVSCFHVTLAEKYRHRSFFIF
ncbi:MAG TPA: DUF5715 family protein [bacterium]|nr:DUF5715 family protein [bacterium]